MPQEITSNEKEAMSPESGKQDQAAASSSSDEQNLAHTSKFRKRVKTSGLVAAASLLRSDEGISYAQHIWHLIRDGFKRNSSILGEEAIPLTPNIKQTALGAAATFTAALATEYSWDYFFPSSHSSPSKKDEISKTKEENSSNLDKKTAINNNNRRFGAFVVNVVPVATAIGSALIRDKHGISYAQILLEKVKDSPLDRSKIIPSRDMTRLGAVSIYALTLITTIGASLAVHKIYNRTVDGKEKQL